MLIRTFKYNQPFLAAALPIFALLIWIYGFMNPIEINVLNPMPLFEIVNRIVSYSTFISYLTGYIFMIIGAFTINYIVNKHEISKRSYIPGLIYITISSNQIEALQLNPILISNIFLLLAIDQLLEIYRREYTFSEIFNAGLLISISAFFYYPSILFLILIGIALLLFHPFIWREWVIAILGAAIPFVFLFVYYFWNNTPLVSFLEKTTNFSVSKNYLSHFGSSMKVFIGVVVVLLILSTAATLTNVKGVKLKTKKSLALNYWYLAICFVSIVTSRFTSTETTLIAVPLSIIFADYFVNTKKSWWAELLFIILAASSLSNLYYHPY